jgi:pimeloyl-ACP methyl ester carboxylesterase
MPFAELSNSKIWYEIDGVGDTLIQIPGGALGLKNFSKVTPVLAQHFQVVNFDVVGTGKSSPPPAGYRLEDWATDLYDLMEFLEISKANLHGTSTGGMIALEFASEYPEKVGKMILVGVVAKYDTAFRLNRKIAKALAENVGMEAVAELTAQSVLTRNFLDTPEAGPLLDTMRTTFSEILPESYVRTMEACEAADLGPKLEGISAPTLVISGEHSTYSPVDTGPKGIGGRGIAQGVLEGKLVVLEGAGHLVMMERYQEICDHIVEFLKS